MFNEENPPDYFRGPPRVAKQILVASMIMKCDHVTTVPLESQRTVKSEWYCRICIPTAFVTPATS